MKRFLLLFGLVAVLATVALTVSWAAPLGRATGDFDNAHPQRSETEFGRLVADALRNATRADIALVNAGAFKAGTLKAGNIDTAQINALLAFPNDGVATVTLSGEQLRAALERAVQAYPTGTTAFLHGSGFSAGFNTQAPTNQRLTMLRVNGREVQNDDSFSVAMPTPLAEGGSGYFTIWNGESAQRSNLKVGKVVADWVSAQGNISPDQTPRLAPQ